VTGERRPSPSLRLTDDEIWDFVAAAHTGIFTTLRRDGVPIAMPVWFACHDRKIYIRTRGKKLKRVAHDRRASFLVESGEKWAELKAVHFTGSAELVHLDTALAAAVAAELTRKYTASRTATKDMPAKTAEHYASSMQWVRFTPDERILNWDNAKLLAPAWGGSPGRTTLPAASSSAPRPSRT
jgi:nitroimidazol reductase NimA-like FMN-containing flavoprotein (pyridoxamine 5'-phosphate oxidase superfamily)